MLIMETIFTLNDIDDENQRVNLDDLYEKKKQQDLSTLSTYNKILNRIHNKIKTISRQHAQHQYCWYLIPEMMIGVPKYDHGACIAFCIDKLRENGFMIRYTHPNLLLISWKHWIPSYVRSEIKKKTGVNVDGYGNKIIKDENKKAEETNPNSLMFQSNKISIAPKTDFKEINTYKPTGNLIYNQDLLKNIEHKSKK
tara:strand:- start:250 stop:840 length:591 start_codon:yes stop_codon:yes gene_type:complete